MADMNNSLSGPTPYADAYGISAPTGYEAGLERSLALLDTFKNNNPQFFGGPGGRTVPDGGITHAKNLANAPIKLSAGYEPAGYQEPIQFSGDLLKFDRYYNHPSYNKLGFHPFRDNETFYNENTHWTEDYSRMFGQAGKLFGAGFVGTYETIGDIFQGETLNFSDDISKTYEEASMIGSSSRGGLVGFGNNLILNSAYTAGIITDYAVSELALAALTYGSGGGLTPVTGTAAAGKTAQFAKAMGGIWDIFKAQNNVKRVINGVDAVQDVTKMRRFFDSVVSGLNPLENTMQFAKELAATEGQIYKMTNLAKVSKGFGAFYRDTKAAAMTWSESKLEAGMVEQEVKQDLIDKYVKENGSAPVGSEMQRIEEMAYGAATTTALYNAPLIYATNAITFGTLFKGYKPLAETAAAEGDALIKGVSRASRAADDFMYRRTPGAFKAAWEFAKKPSVKAGFGYLGRYASGNFSEGLQEIGQEIVAGAAKDYYEGLYDDPAYAYGSIWTSSMGKATQDMMSAQGLEVFMSGFLMGGIAGPFTKMLYGVGSAAEYLKDPAAYREAKQKREQAFQEIVTSLNEAGKDPGQFFNNFYNSFVRQRKTAAEAVEAGINDDQLSAQNAKDKALIEQVHNLLKVNGLDQYNNYLESLKKLSFAEIKEAIPQLAGRTEKETINKIEKIQARMKDIANTYVAAYKEVGKSPYRPQLYKKGTPEYINEVIADQAWKEGIRQLVFYKQAFKRHAERQDAVLNEAKQNPAVGKASYTDYSVLFSREALNNEIEALKAEVQIEALDAEQQKVLAIKQERLDILTRINDGLEAASFTNSKGQKVIDRRKLSNNVQKPYEEFIQHLSENTASPIDSQNARKTLSLMMDSHTLGSDAATYQEMYNMIADPVGFRDAHPRIQAALTEVFNKRAAMSNEIAAKFDSTLKQQELIKSLAKLGVVIAPEQIEDFMQNNTRPTKFYYVDTTDLVDTENSSDPVAQAIRQIVALYYAREAAARAKAEGSQAEAEESLAQSEEQASQMAASEATVLLNDYMRSALFDLYSNSQRAAKAPLSYQEWELTPAGENAITAFIEVQQMYEASGSTENISQWLEDNKTNQNLLDTIAKRSMKVSDFIGVFSDPNVFIKGSLPAGYTLETAKGNKGVFIVSTKQGQDENEVTRYFLVNNRSSFIGQESYATIEDAQKGQQKLAEQYALEADKFMFMGQAFYAGQIVNNGRGVTFKVLSTRKQMTAAEKQAGESAAVKPVLRLEIVEDANNPKRVGNIEEQTYVTGNMTLYPGPYKSFEEKDLYKILDVWKYTKVYAHTSEEDMQEASSALLSSYYAPETRLLANKLAEQRLKNLLENTPIDELRSRMGVRITRNNNVKGESILSVDGKTNPHVKERRERIEIAITLDGEVIGYSRSLQNIAFLDEFGNTIPYYEAFKNHLILRRVFKSSMPLNALQNLANSAFSAALKIQKSAEAALGDENSVTLSYDEMADVMGEIVVDKGSYSFAKTSEAAKMSELNHSTIEGGYYIIDRRAAAEKGDRLATSAEKRSRIDITNLKGTKKAAAKAKIDAEISANPNVLDNRGRYILAVELPNGSIKFVSLISPALVESVQETMVGNINKLATDAATNGSKPNFNNDDANAEMINALSYIALKPGTFASIRINNEGKLVVTLSNTINPKSSKSNSISIASSRNLAEEPIQSFEEFVQLINEAIDSRRNLISSHNGLNRVTISADSFKSNIPSGAQVNDFVKLDMSTDVTPEIVGSISMRISPKKSESTAPTGDKPSNSKRSALDMAFERLAQEEQAAGKATESDLTITFTEDPVEAPVTEDEAKGADMLNAMGRASQAMQDPNEIGNDLNKLVATKKALEKQLQDVRKVVRTELINQGISASDLISARDADERVQKIQSQIDAVEAKLAANRPSAKKVIRKNPKQYTEVEAEAIDTFIDWVTKNLPRSISVTRVNTLRENLHAGNITVGEFVMGMTAIAGNIQSIRGRIRVGASTPFRYHEAFHAVFRMLLTDEEIERYLGSAKKEVNEAFRSSNGYVPAGSGLTQGLKSIKEATQWLKKQDPMYAEMTQRELEDTIYEEYLADKFEGWKKDIKVNTSPTNKSLFAMIVDFIKALFGVRGPKSLYQDLFQDIEGGKYSTAEIQPNRFTKAVQEGVPAIAALKTIKTGDQDIVVNGQLRQVSKYFAGDQSMRLIAALAAAKYKIDTDGSEYSKLSDEAKYDKIFSDFEKHYDYQDEEYVLHPDYELIEENLREFWNVIVEQRDELVEAVEEHLKLMGVAVEDAENESEDAVNNPELDEAEDSSTDKRMEKYTIGGMKSLSGYVRLYIMSTPLPVGIFGKAVQEDSYAFSVVNGGQIYNGLLHALEGTVDPIEQLHRLKHYLPLAESSRPSETSLFVKRLFEDFNIQFDEDGAILLDQIVDSSNLRAILGSFQKFRVDYKFFAFDKGVVRMIDANQRDDAKTQFELWRSGFYAAVNSRGSKEVYAETKSALEDIVSTISEGKERNFTAIVELSDNLYKASGIYIEPIYIQHAILKKSQEQGNITNDEAAFLESLNIPGLDVEDLVPVIDNLSKQEDPFLRDGATDEEVDFSGSAGRIQRVAAGNVRFNDTVGATSFVNADNEIVWGHQIPTYELRRGREIRKFVNQEGALSKEDAFIQENILLESPEFLEMLKTFNISRVDGIKLLSLSLEDGEVKRTNFTSDRNVKGKTYDKFGDQEYMAIMLSMYFGGKKKTYKDANGITRAFQTVFANLGPIESTSTMDIAETTAHPMVELKGKEVVLSAYGKEMLTKMLQKEYENITRVQKEINDPLISKVDGYHTGMQRGLHFMDMIFLVADETLRTNLEAAAIEGVPFEDAIKEYPVSDSIESAFEDLLEGQLDYMSEIGMLKKVKDYYVPESGIPFNIINGVTLQKAGKDSDAVVDNEANVRLNVVSKSTSIPSSVVLKHNLAQVLMSNFVSVQGLQNLMYGHTGKLINPKKLDIGTIGVEYVKRKKGVQSGGANAYNPFVDTKHGINFPTESVDVKVLDDEKYLSLFTGTEANPSDGDKTDAQMVLTTRTFRHFMGSWGKMNDNLSDLLDKVERGEEVTADEYFGDGTVKGHIQFRNSLISVKLAYFSVDNGKEGYLKTSALVLTPRLTSVKDKSGNWTAYPGREKIHDLRVEMEAQQELEGSSKLAAAVFQTGSKGASYKESYMPKSAKDFVLQQENPSNKEKVTNMSQVAQSVESDIPDNAVVYHRGESNNAKSLKRRHSTLAGARLEIKYEDSIKDIIDDVDTAARTGKTSYNLAKLATKIKETLESIGASPKEIEMFTLDENGNLKANLNNVAVEERFYQMYLTYMVNGVFKEKIPGHSLTLVSNYGFKVVKRATGKFDESGNPIGEVVRDSEIRKNPSKYSDLVEWSEGQEIKAGDLYMDELRHNVPVYNDKGVIVDRYTEVMMPPQTYDAAKYLKGGVIPDAVARLFGVRIPSQDKHSSVAIKVVDFLPVEYGSIIVSPHELIEISGADFDIDKLYAAANNYFYNKKTRQFEAYGDVKSMDDKFRHFVTYQFKTNKEFREAYYQQQVIAKEIDIDKFKSDLKGKTLSLEELKDMYVPEKDTTNLVENTLKQLGLPSTVKEYEAAYKAKGHDIYVGALDTEIMQLKTALTFNDYTSAPRTEKTGDRVKDSAPAFQVAHVEPLKDVIKNLEADLESLIDTVISEDLSQEEKEKVANDILNIFKEEFAQHNTMLGQAKARRNNKEGAVNIGAAVKSFLSWEFLQKKGIVANQPIVTLNGVEYVDYGNPVGADGQRKGYILSALISAMTDNAKERLASKLGLNIEALGYVAHMVAVGAPLKQAILLVNQPVIRKYFTEKEKINNELSKGNDRYKNKKRDILSIMASVLTDANGKPFFESGSALEEELKKSVDTLTEENLTQRIMNARAGVSDVMHDVEVINAIYRLNQFAPYFAKVANITGLVKGINNTTEQDFNKIDEDIKSLSNNGKYNPYKNIEGGSDVIDAFVEDPYVSTALKIYEKIKKDMAEIFTRRSKTFLQVKDTVYRMMDVKQFRAEEFEKNLVRDMISYFDIIAYKQYLKTTGRHVELKSLDNALIFAEDGKKTVVEYIGDLKAKYKEAGKSNEFLDRFIHAFEAESPANRKGFDYIETNTWSRVEPTQLSRLQSAFVDLYNTDPEAATAIMHYVLVKDAGQFRSGSISNIIPLALMNDLHEATRDVHTVLNNESSLNEYMRVFGMSQRDLKLQFTKNYPKHVTISSGFVSKQHLREIPMLEEAEDKERRVVIQNEDGTLTLDLFAGVPKKEVEKYDRGGGITFTESAEETEVEKQERKGKASDISKENLKKLITLGFTPNKVVIEKDGELITKAKGLFAPTAFVFDNKVYYLETTKNVGKDQVTEDSMGLPIGVTFTYKRGDTIGSYDTSRVQFAIGEVPTTKRINETFKKNRDAREGIETPVDANTTEAPKTVAPQRQASTPVNNPNEVLAANGVFWLRGTLEYTDAEGNEIAEYKGKKPAQVAAMFSSTPQLGVRTWSGDKITSLKANQIFVFGSNEGSSKGAAPTHGAGSAKVARDKFGAVQGQSRGIQGQSYGIVTKKYYDVERSSSAEEITSEIKNLYKYAEENPTKEFLISNYSGKNLNGYTAQEMADMFNNAGPIPGNVVFNEKFAAMLSPVSAVASVTPENISSKGSEFAKKLTNVGNTVGLNYKGKRYINSEHAYQTWKSGEFNQAGYDLKGGKVRNGKIGDTYAIMVDILTEKLRQNPSLIQGINERGGLEYINQSTHNVIGDKFWESTGENKFIEALAEAYSNVSSAPAESSSTLNSTSITLENALDSKQLMEEYLAENGVPKSEIDDIIAGYEVIASSAKNPATKKAFINKQIEKYKDCK